ncbi:DsbA family protein [Paenalcaligenes sp. Me131]|uniref:DsbA family protein n=1 Tax=Paenalcaligenes sp. Me131 TaxID=3392636 RepID=UPI003D2AD3AB
MMNCDPVTGACILPESDTATRTTPALRQGPSVHYVGDPMCSWCWGISPTVNALADFCAGEGIAFTLTMGGLRAGGGDPWSPQFKDFLRNEWQHIAQVTGQPFGFTLLETPHFNYDTEPACRAVSTVKLLQAKHSLPEVVVQQFFSAVQQKFYVEGQDTTKVDFYAELCTRLGLDVTEFNALFDSPEAKQAVHQEFVRCRQWGVRSFPTILLERNGEVSALAVGMVTTEQLLTALKEAIAA